MKFTQPQFSIVSNEEEHTINFQGLQVVINNKPLDYVVDCELTYDVTTGYGVLNIIQDKFIYALRE